MPSIKSWLSSTAPRAPRQRAVKRADPKHIARERPPFWRGEARQEGGGTAEIPPKIPGFPTGRGTKGSTGKREQLLPELPGDARAVPHPAQYSQSHPSAMQEPRRGSSVDKGCRSLAKHSQNVPTSHIPQLEYPSPSFEQHTWFIPRALESKFLLLIPTSAPGAFVSHCFAHEPPRQICNSRDNAETLGSAWIW